MLSKKDLLLEVTMSAVAWPEGSDFEWNEIVGESEYFDDIRFYYEEEFPLAFDENGSREIANKFRDKLRDDCLEMLRSLKKTPASAYEASPSKN